MASRLPAVSAEERDVAVVVIVRPPRGVDCESIALDMQTIVDLGADQARKLLRVPDNRAYACLVHEVKVSG